MTQKELKTVKQMLVSENTEDINLIGPIIQVQLFKDENCFKQFIELLGSPCLYNLKDILLSSVINVDTSNYKSNFSAEFNTLKFNLTNQD